MKNVDACSVSEATDLPGCPTKKRARATDAGLFRLEPHCCRACFGRIVSRPAEGGREYLCACCGLSAVGAKASVVCACGMTLRKTSKAGGASTPVRLVDMGIRCHENGARSPEFPQLIVASYGGAQAVDA